MHSVLEQVFYHKKVDTHIMYRIETDAEGSAARDSKSELKAIERRAAGGEKSWARDTEFKIDERSLAMPLSWPSFAMDSIQLEESDYSFSSETGKHSWERLLAMHARAICVKYNLRLEEFTPIQRKFLTHYRCGQCGLLPLYHLDLSHIKRVRCRNCKHLVAFTTKGKYGKMRKHIAIGLSKLILEAKPIGGGDIIADRC
jgi:DNA-directed RNA polymerase subunit RPC12/RpoP